MTCTLFLERFNLNKHFNFINDHTHSHDYFEIYYIFKDNCEFEKEHRVLVEGELCIIADNNDSIIISIAIRKITFDNTFFTLLSQKDLLSYFFKSILYIKLPNYLLFHTKNSKDIKIIIKNLILENNKDDQNNFKTLTLSVLAEYFHYSESNLSVLIKKL